MEGEEEGREEDQVYGEVIIQGPDGTYTIQQQQQPGVYVETAGSLEDVLVGQKGEDGVVYIVQPQVVEMEDGTYAVVDDEGLVSAIDMTGIGEGETIQVTVRDGPDSSELSVLNMDQTDKQVPEVEINEQGDHANGRSLKTVQAVLRNEVPKSADKKEIKKLSDDDGEETTKFVLCCQFCGEGLDTLADLTLHLLEEHDYVEDNIDEDQEEEDTITVGGFPTCEYCEATYLDEKDLKEHMESCHENKHNQMGLEYADESGVAETKQKKEVMKTTAKLQHKCQFCEKSFSVRSDLNDHIEEGHGESTEYFTGRRGRRPQDSSAGTSYVRCPYCERLFLSKWLKKSLIRHIRVDHPGQPCDVEFEFVEISERPEMSEDSDQTFSCSLCDKSFMWRKSMMRHVKTYHAMELNEMKPDEVTRTFGFIWRRRNVGKREILDCPNCSKGFKSKKRRWTHMQEDHGYDDEEIAEALNEVYTGTGKNEKCFFKCPCCSLISKYAHSVKKHISLKHGGVYQEGELDTLVLPTVDPVSGSSSVKVLDKRPYEEKLKELDSVFKCPLCEYGSANRSNIIRHIRSKRHENDFTEEDLKNLDISGLRVVNKSPKQIIRKKDSVSKEKASISGHEEMSSQDMITSSMVNENQSEGLHDGSSELEISNKEDRLIHLSKNKDHNDAGAEYTSKEGHDSVLEEEKDKEKSNDGKDEEADAAVPKECIVCEKRCSGFSELISHYKIHVNLKLTYSCNICKHKVGRFDLLKEHHETHHSRSVFSSTELNSVSVEKVKMDLKPVTTFDCPYCEIVLSQAHVLDQHIIINHAKLVEKIRIKQDPDAMEDDSESQSMFMKNLSVSAAVSTFPCQYCPCIYNQVKDIVKHMSLIHPEVDKSALSEGSGSVRKSGRKRKVRDFGDDFESDLVRSPAKSARKVLISEEEVTVSRSVNLSEEVPRKKRGRKPKNHVTRNNGEENSSHLEVDSVLLLEEKTDGTEIVGTISPKQIRGFSEEDKQNVVPSTPNKTKEMEEETEQGKKEVSSSGNKKLELAAEESKMFGSENSSKKKVGRKRKSRATYETVEADSTKTGSIFDINHEISTNKCPHCSFSCKRSSALTFHINFNHTKIKEEPADPEYDAVEAKSANKNAIDSRISDISSKFDENRTIKKEGTVNMDHESIVIGQGMKKSNKKEFLPKNRRILQKSQVGNSKKNALDSEDNMNLDLEDDNDADYNPAFDDSDEESGIAQTLNYHCPYCDKCKTPSAKIVEIHVQKLHPDKTFSLEVCKVRKSNSLASASKLVLICFHCKQQFDSRMDVEQHIIEDHKDLFAATKIKPEAKVSGSNERYKCSYCDFLCNSKGNVMRHVVLKHPDEKPLEREDIEAAYDLEGGYLENRYSCPFCLKYRSKLRKSTIRHIRSHHRDKLDEFHVDNIPCEIIVQPKIDNLEMEKVETIKSEDSDNIEKHYFCPYCNASTTWKKSLVKHVKLLHEDMVDVFDPDGVRCELKPKKIKVPEIGYFSCPYCSVVNKWKKSIVRHIRTNHPGKPENLDINFSLKSGSSKRGYVINKIKKKLDCLLCGFQCRSKQLMMNHFSATHPNIVTPGSGHYRSTYEIPRERKARLTHACPRCGIRYLWKKSVLLHMKTHHPEDVGVYLTLDRLVEIVHNTDPGPSVPPGEETKCAHCMMKLPNMAALMRHYKLKHSNRETRAQEIRRRCSKCRQSFTSNPALVRHALRCHGSSIGCGHCSRKFRTDLERRVHEKLMHSSQVLECPMAGCHYRCSLKVLLKQHVGTHTSITGLHSVYKCEICQRMYQDKSQLKHHLMSIHTKVPRGLEAKRRHYRCESCPSVFDTPTDRDNHIAEAHTDKTIMCEICGSVFPTERLLQRHMNKHGLSSNVLDQVTCNHCGKKLYRKNMKKHFYFKHPQLLTCDCDICSSLYDGNHPLACRFCSLQFCSKIMLFVHNKLNHAQTEPVYYHNRSRSLAVKYKCDLCNQYFRTQKEHNLHLHECHKNVDSSANQIPQPDMISDVNDKASTHVIHVGPGQGKQYLPKMCDSSFGAVIKELVQVTDKNSKLPYKCLLCGRCFAKTKYIRLHIRRAHVKDEDQPYRCKVCGSGFVRLTEFRKHSRAHSGFRPYKCTKCSKAFKQQANLMEHMYVHEESKLFKCAICGKDFRQRGALNAHVNCHDMLKPFKCMFCSKGFTTRGELSRHMQKYDGDESKVRAEGGRNFLCHICEQTFNHYPLLLKHIEEHNPEKPFECVVCEVKFTSYMSLYSHKQKVGHFLDTEIEDVSSRPERRGRKPAPASSTRDIERAVSSLQDEDQQMYGEEISVHDNILINTSEGTYVLEETMSKPIEVVIGQIEPESVSYETEDTQRSENDELLSIAKQLTELSSYTELEGHVVQTGSPNVVSETAQMLKQEDEIMKDMLDADTVLLASIDRINAGKKWSQESEFEKTPLLRENLVSKSTSTFIPDQTVEEIEENVSEMTDYTPMQGDTEDPQSNVVVVENDSHMTVYTSLDDGTEHSEQSALSSSKPVLSNMEELAALIPSLVQNEFTAYQSQDGSTIFLCLSDQVEEKTVETEVNEEKDEAATEMVDTVTEEINNVGEDPATTYVEVRELEAPLNQETHVEALEAARDEVEEEQIITIAAGAEDVGVATENPDNVIQQLQNAAQLVEQPGVETYTADHAYQDRVVEYANDEKTFIQEEILDENFAKSLAESCTFKYLGQSFQYKYDLVERKFQCLECNFKVRTAKYLKVHMKRHVAKKNRKFTCMYCPKRFVTNSELKRHIAIHTNERKYKCKECGKAFRQQGHLSDHNKVHNGYKPFACPACPAKFITKSNFQTHWTRHHETERVLYNCEECGKTFINREGLNKHMGREHSAVFGDEVRKQKVGDYQCHVCGASFSLQNYLNRHLLKHETRKFMCEVCGQSFLRQTNLKRHIAKEHSEETPHVCEYCGDAFKVREALQTHIKKHKKPPPTVTPKQKWPCNICGKVFATKGSLAYHGGASKACRQAGFIKVESNSELA